MSDAILLPESFSATIFINKKTTLNISNDNITVRICNDINPISQIYLPTNLYLSWKVTFISCYK